jgi:hypothetical protein
MGQNLTFWTFQEKPLLHRGCRIAILAKSSEMTVQRNSLRGRNPQVISVPQVLQEKSGIRPCETVQKDCTNEGTSPDADGVSYITYIRSLNVTKAQRYFFLFKGALTHVLQYLSFLGKRFLAKGKVMSLAEAFCLNNEI